MSDLIAVPKHKVDSLAEKLNTARSEVERLQGRCGELEHLIRYAQVESGVCMCGDEIESHNQASGHSPVDIWDYAAEKALEGTSEAWLLRKQAEAVEEAARLMDAAGNAFDAKFAASDYAQRLRQQADEAEKAGGEQ